MTTKVINDVQQVIEKEVRVLNNSEQLTKTILLTATTGLAMFAIGYSKGQSQGYLKGLAEGAVKSAMQLSVNVTELRNIVDKLDN